MLATALFLVLLRQVYIYTYWLRHGIRGPTPVPLFGNMLQDVFHSIPELDKKNIAKYGKVYGVYEMSKPILVVADPELLRQLLIRDFNFITDRRFHSNHRIAKHFLLLLKGEEWRRARNTVTPTMTPAKIKAVMPLMDDCVEKLLQTIGKRTQESNVIDVQKLFGCYVVDVIAKCAFATDAQAHDDHEPNSFLVNVHNLVSQPMIRFLPYLLFPKRLLDLFGYSASIPGSMDFMDNAVRTIIQQRTAGNGPKVRDLIQLLIEAGEDGDQEMGESAADTNFDPSCNDPSCNDPSIGPSENKTRKKFLTDDEIVGNAILIFVAGYETTGSLMTSTTYALAKHPEIQEKLRQEIIGAVKDNGNKMDYDLVSTLPYLDAVISETLRLYSPGVRSERQVSRDYRIESLNLNLKKGDIIRVPIYAMHNYEPFFEQADKFMPERFSSRDKIIPYSYMPFGTGPRSCIGMRFALLEAKYGICSILLKYKFLTCDRTPDPPDFSSSKFILTAKQVHLSMTPVSQLL